MYKYNRFDRCIYVDVEYNGPIFTKLKDRAVTRFVYNIFNLINRKVDTEIYGL